MLDFDERDLVRLAEAAGFFPVRLDLRLDVEPPEPRSWERLPEQLRQPERADLRGGDGARRSPPDEAERFIAYLRPRVEQGLGRWRMGHAYLWATKPG